MGQNPSFAARPAAAGANRHRARGLWAMLAVAALIVVACAAPAGGSPSAPAATSGQASASAPASAASSPAIAYPEAPIRVIVPFAAGGPTDTVTRLVAEPMSATLGQEIIVENVAGAGGTLAAGQVATAAADGYTVLMHHIGMSTAPSLYPDLPYDPLVDFKTIGLVTEVPMTIVGRKSFAPTTLQELVDHVKANGMAVRYANAGIGAASHLCGLLFMTAVDAKVTEVPYDGTGPAMEDLLGDQDVDFMCDQTTNTTTQIKAGTVKAYAITSPERNEALPDVPTTSEGGLPDLEIGVWHGLYVPKDTPDEIVQALTGALQGALTDANVIAKFAELGTVPVPADQATPEAHTAKLQAQIELWKPIIEAAGVTP
ncbi:MAG: tripartite tricarboxylate transporter substrate binding protein BugD [Chloroflexota bacterium]|jgi:tripartite-type tricarboxylate transporter receptor subunit TctC|nr:tripartite tricarboxylate transporter substrate binding protein BugD [Chloroflexota bacterium]